MLSFQGGYNVKIKKPLKIKDYMKNLNIYLLIFLFGFFSCAFAFYVLSSNFNLTSFAVKNIESGSNWIDRANITLFSDKVIIKVANSTLGSYTDTGSMEPIMNENTKGIEIRPENEEQILVGDIVVFRDGDRLIAHRVVEKGIDEVGVYFITKGDNNDFSDGKIRFSDIESVVVGVVW